MFTFFGLLFGLYFVLCLFSHFLLRGVIMFENGIFGGLFDLDGDGKLNAFEQGLEFMAISELMEEDEDSASDDDF